MGTWWSGDELDQMIARLPAQCILFLDEAYVDFAPEGTSPNIDLDNQQVLRFRTFSKAYGLAGARVGYAIGNEKLIKAFDKIRNHYGMNCFAIQGANAALRDQDWLQHVVQEVASARKRIVAIAADNGLITLASAANFVAIDCARDGDFARAVLAELSAQGIFVRMPGVAPQDRCIRVSAGTKEDLDLFAECLPIALERAGAK
jgi:histidinol-phosphate aminotransferase